MSHFVSDCVTARRGAWAAVALLVAGLVVSGGCWSDRPTSQDIVDPDALVATVIRESPRFGLVLLDEQGREVGGLHEFHPLSGGPCPQPLGTLVATNYDASPAPPRLDSLDITRYQRGFAGFRSVPLVVGGGRKQRRDPDPLGVC